MPPRKVNNRTKAQRKSDLLDSIGPTAAAMRPCKNCVSRGLSCLVGEGSEKCTECIRSQRTCDLAISPVTLKRIHNERVRMKKEVREARIRLQNEMARVQRLEKQLEFLENQEEELVVSEWRNIHDLEEQEQQPAPVNPSVPDLLFDVSSELFELPPDLDWSAVSFSPPSGGTVATSSGSSQGA